MSFREDEETDESAMSLYALGPVHRFSDLIKGKNALHYKVDHKTEPRGVEEEGGVK